MHTVVQSLWSVGQLAVADLIFSKRRSFFRVWRLFGINDVCRWDRLCFECLEFLCNYRFTNTIQRSMVYSSDKRFFEPWGSVRCECRFQDNISIMAKYPYYHSTASSCTRSRLGPYSTVCCTARLGRLPLNLFKQGVGKCGRGKPLDSRTFDCTDRKT